LLLDSLKQKHKCTLCRQNALILGVNLQEVYAVIAVFLNILQQIGNYMYHLLSH